jgi:predicted dehydrogenase
MGGFLHQPNCHVVALSDVFGRNLKAAVAQVQQAYGAPPTLHHNFQDLLARADIDAVVIATPDHWHVPAALAAAQAGKDIYLEKPMGLSVEADQRLRAACRRGKRVFQFGTQQRSSGQFRLACELVRNGRIGKLEHINVWAPASRPGGSTDPINPPEDLDYPTWLGTAPRTPYTLGKACDEQGAWKTWWFNADYALGFIAGWGVHPLDIAYWGFPGMMQGIVKLEGTGVIPEEGACNTATAWDVKFRFANGVTMRFRGTRNGAEPSKLNDLSEWKKKYGRITGHGTAFNGSDGWVLVDRGQIRTWPENLVETQFGPGAIRLPRSSNHARNFLDAVKSRRSAISPIEDAVQADILCHLSNIAVRLGRKLKWNGGREQFLNDDTANQCLKPRSARV